MINGEKYKTAEERVDAFNKWCHSQECAKCPIQSKCRETNDGSFYWLEFEAEEEKPLPCPFCGSKCELVKATAYEKRVACLNMECGYHSQSFPNEAEVDAIVAHNRVAKAVKES